MSGGSPEQGLLSAACAQVGGTFNLPFGTVCGITDSKFPDFQAGAERASTALAAALSGANIVYESAGMYASLLGKPVLLDKAIARKKEIPGTFFPSHVSDEIDRSIRDKFPIFLSRKDIGRT